MELISTQAERFIKDNGSKENSMVKGNIFSQTVLGITESGVNILCMAKAYLWIDKEFNGKGYL